MSAPTFFDTLATSKNATSFADLPIHDCADGITNAIPTAEFLAAARGLTSLFDSVIGGLAFAPVQNDMNGNINKVLARYEATKAKSEFVQSLVKAEKAEGKNTATEGLLWLVRGLDFTARALRHNVKNTCDELSTSFRNSYSETLKPHHSFLVKPIFSAAMGATPRRAEFYRKLGPDETKVCAQMDAWLCRLEKTVEILSMFLVQEGVEKKK